MFLIAAPLIILGCIPYWPQGNGTAILFYISYCLAPILHWLSVYLVIKRGYYQSDSIASGQIVFSYTVILMPVLAFVMYVIPMNSTWQMVTTLIIELLLGVIFSVITIIYSQVEKKINHDIKVMKVIIKTGRYNRYENNDNTFKGSSWKNNND